jgi:hypothetical protein
MLRTTLVTKRTFCKIFEFDQDSGFEFRLTFRPLNTMASHAVVYHTAKRLELCRSGAFTNQESPPPTKRNEKAKRQSCLTEVGVCSGSCPSITSQVRSRCEDTGIAIITLSRNSLGSDEMNELLREARCSVRKDSVSKAEDPQLHVPPK